MGPTNKPLTKQEQARIQKAYDKTGSLHGAQRELKGKYGYGTIRKYAKQTQKERGFSNPESRKIRDLERTIAGLEKHVEEARDANRRTFLKTKPSRNLQRDTCRVIIPDLHGAYLDPDAVAVFFDDLKKLNPDVIVQLGDVIEAGGFMSGHHVDVYAAQTAYSYEHDVAAANQFLDRLAELCPSAEVHMLQGNHDHRVERWCVAQTLRSTKDAMFLERCVGPESAMKLKDRGIRYYRKDTQYQGLPICGAMRLGTAKHPCYFTHGISTAKHAAHAHFLQFGSNVVFGHTHRIDKFAGNTVHGGSFEANSPGCLCKLSALWLHGSPNNWQHGYGVQIVNKSGRFSHQNVRIENGHSDLVKETKLCA